MKNSKKNIVETKNDEKVPLRFAVYYRVSTESQLRDESDSDGKKKKKSNDGLGLGAQRQIINNYTPRYGVIEKEFIEVKSAKNITDRPILQQAIKYCNENGCVLAVYRLDRLSRDVKDGITIFEHLKNGLFSCDVPLENGIITDTFMLNFGFMFAQRERELISLRTKNALDNKKYRGELWNVGGNKNIKEIQKNAIKARKEGADPNNNLKRAKNEAKVLRSQGKTYSEIATILTENGHVTSMSEANNLLKEPYKWFPMTVKRLLGE
jgi:DNA invertase Pin-like site-specific DNA recombinase